MSSTLQRILVAILICLSGSGSALQAGDRRGIEVSVAAVVQNCTLVDDLLRGTCARIGHHLSEQNRKYCALPVASFGQRITEPYRAFRESRREAHAAHQAAIDEAAGIARRAFSRQFAEVIAGRVSMLDLESLHREATGPCTDIERMLRSPDGFR